jgi:hypothetical protein
MRLWLLGRIWPARKRARPDAPESAGAASQSAQPGVAGARTATLPGSHRRSGRVRRPPRSAAARGPAGTVQAPPRTPRPPAVPVATGGAPHPPNFGQTPARTPGGPAVSTQSQPSGQARAAIRTAPRTAKHAIPRPAEPQDAAPLTEARTQWYELATKNRRPAGWRDCGSLEAVLHREWTDLALPPPEAVTAINRLADLPRLIKDRLASNLDAIYVGGGGVPDLDDMGKLSGVLLPSGRATWDACAGAYGDRKIVVGSRPSPTPDVMCHEIGHALDDIDGQPGRWQSDSDDFCALYEGCLPHMISNLHRQRGILGRREFFADAFAAIASKQRPALVDMLGGDTRSALNVMLFFNVRYGI